MENKEIIVDGVDVSGCEFLRNCIIPDNYGCKIDDSLCCDVTNCYYKQLKRKEQECEKLKKELHKNFEEKDTLHLIIDRLLEAGGYDTNTASAEDFEDVYENIRYEKQQLDQLKAELKSAKELREYTYDCCKQAGEELAKNSFEWDGKEKNLVVQAIELNERYDQLKGVIKKYEECNKYLVEENGKTYTRLEYKLLKTLTEIREIAEKWMLNNRMGSALREIASNIRRGLIPACPHCKMPFDLDNLKSWTSKEYAEAIYQQKLLKKEVKCKE